MYNKEIYKLLNNNDKYKIIIQSRIKDNPIKVLQITFDNTKSELISNMKKYMAIAKKYKARIYIYIIPLNTINDSFFLNRNKKCTVHNLIFRPKDFKNININNAHIWFQEIKNNYLVKNNYNFNRYTIDLDFEYLKYKDGIINYLNQQSTKYYILPSKTGFSILVDSKNSEEELNYLGYKYPYLKTYITGWVANLYIPDNID